MARSSSRVLTAAELSEVSQLNALQAIELLRPGWLQSRGRVTIDNPENQRIRVVVNNGSAGELQDLAGIPVTDVREMRYLNAREATTRYGTGYPEGIVVVITRQ